jgi:putative copper export protein
MVKVGRRFNNIALPAFGILIITGIYNSHSFFNDPTALLETSYGIILLIKIILVIATLITYIIHIRILNTNTERNIESGISGSIYIQSIRSKIINLGRITVVMSVTILLLAALLHSGGLS